MQNVAVLPDAEKVAPEDGNLGKLALADVMCRPADLGTAELTGESHCPLESRTGPAGIDSESDTKSCSNRR